MEITMPIFIKFEIYQISFTEDRTYTFVQNSMLQPASELRLTKIEKYF